MQNYRSGEVILTNVLASTSIRIHRIRIVRIPIIVVVKVDCWIVVVVVVAVEIPLLVVSVPVVIRIIVWHDIAGSSVGSGSFVIVVESGVVISVFIIII